MDYALNATDAASIHSPSLTFARSESRALGYTHSLGHKIGDFIKNHAAMIVGVLGLAAVIIPAIAGQFDLDPENPGLHDLKHALTLHMAGVLGAEAILIKYGDKESREEAAQQYAGQAELSAWKKPFNPKRYPLESSAALHILGEAAVMFEGFEHGIFAEGNGHEGHGHAPGEHPIHIDELRNTEHGNTLFGFHGLFAAVAHLPILFGKEGNHTHYGNSLTFAKSESKAQGVIGKGAEYLRENPVGLSSILQFGIGSAFIAFTPGWAVPLTGMLLCTAAVVQGLFLRKNIEAPETHITQAAPAERLAEINQEQSY